MNKTRTESIDPMEKQESRTIHILMLMGAFAIGLAFRLIRLGILPLNHMEAELALNALAIARQERAVFNNPMAYVGFTGFSFFLFSTGQFLARFWPALFGALIVFIPFIYRKWIGVWPATIASILLAISPEMVGLSRIIGTPMMGLIFMLLGIGFGLHRKPIFTGLCMGLGLMSGTGFWVGLVILGVSLIISTRLVDVREIFSRRGLESTSTFWIHLCLSFVAALLIVGTAFFRAPSGLTSILSGLHEFFLGFGKAEMAPFGLIPFALLSYVAGAVIFGLWGAIRGGLTKSKPDIFLLIWSGFGLIFLILYPGGGPADLVWVTLPLWILSARVVCLAWRTPESSWLVSAITAVLVVVISAFMLLALRTLVSPTLTQAQQINYLVALVGGVVLVVAIILLVSYGWSQDVAQAGLMLGLALVIPVGMISVSVNTTGLGPEVPYELWYPDEAVLYTEWLEVAIDRVIVWNASSGLPVEIVVTDNDTPGMRWALRHYNPVDFVPFSPPQSQPGIMITNAGTIPKISQGYQGQDLVFSRIVPWREISLNQYLTWLVTREVPTISQEIILWVRTDLMPAGQ